MIEPGQQGVKSPDNEGNSALQLGDGDCYSQGIKGGIGVK